MTFLAQYFFRVLVNLTPDVFGRDSAPRGAQHYYKKSWNGDEPTHPEHHRPPCDCHPPDYRPHQPLN